MRLIVVGIDFLVVQYKGGTDNLVAIGVGDAQLGFNAVTSSLPHIQSGRRKALAFGGLLFGFHAALADESAPFFLLAADVMRELLLSAADDVNTFPGKAFGQFRGAHRSDEKLVDLGCNGWRRADRCQDAVPGGQLVTWHALLSDGWDIGH